MKEVYRGKKGLNLNILRIKILVMHNAKQDRALKQTPSFTIQYNIYV